MVKAAGTLARESEQEDAHQLVLAVHGPTIAMSYQDPRDLQESNGQKLDNLG